MKYKGRIIKIKDNNIARVLLEDTHGCDSCENCGGQCSAHTNIVEVDNSINGNVGDRVYLNISNKHYLSTLFTIYLFPLIVFIVSFAISNSIFNSEGISSLISVSFLILDYILLFMLNKKFNFLSKNKLVISSKIID